MVKRVLIHPRRPRGRRKVAGPDDGNVDLAGQSQPQAIVDLHEGEPASGVVQGRQVAVPGFEARQTSPLSDWDLAATVLQCLGSGSGEVADGLLLRHR